MVRVTANDILIDDFSQLLPVGFVGIFPMGTTRRGWLFCDGRDTTGTEEELETHYPALYTYLGNSNVLPDYRECTLVGVGQNTTDTIAEHDVYTLGEFKDDQLQEHQHYYRHQPSQNRTANPGDQTFSGNLTYYSTTTNASSGRFGTTTHGKQKGVAFYIKAK